MNEKKTLVFSSYSDAEKHHIFVYLKGYGKFILENNLNEDTMKVRLKHWEEATNKIKLGLMVESRNEALLVEDLEVA